MWNAVGPGEHLRDIAGGRRPIGADIGALIGVGAPAQREDRAVLVARDLQFAFGITGMIGGEQMLAPILDPLHRPAAEARRERDQEVLRIELAARAEAAADVVLHHADGAFRQTEMFCQHAPVEERDLGGAVDGQLTARRIPFRQQPARLHRDGAVALDREALAANVCRAVESGIGIAAQAGEGEREIAACGLEQSDVVAPGGRAVDDRGERLDVERDGVERILGGAGAFRQHDRDRLPDIADLAVCDDRLFEPLEFRRGFLPQRNPRDRRADVGCGDDGVDAGARAGSPGLDAADAPVRDRAAQDHGVQKIIAGEVVDELAATAQEAKVLDAFDRAADKGVACTLLIHAHHLTGRRGKSALLGNLHADKIRLISRSSHAG